MGTVVFRRWQMCFQAHKLTSFIDIERRIGRSNAIFEGKVAQLSTLMESTIFMIGLGNFGIVHFKQYTFKLNGNRSQFMGLFKRSIKQTI